MNSAPRVLYFVKQSCSFIKFYNNCFHLTGSVLFFSCMCSYILVFSTRIEPYQTVKILLPQDIVMSYSDLLTDSINFFLNKLYCILHCSLSQLALLELASMGHQVDLQQAPIFQTTLILYVPVFYLKYNQDVLCEKVLRCMHSCF